MKGLTKIIKTKRRELVKLEQLKKEQDIIRSVSKKRKIEDTEKWKLDEHGLFKPIHPHKFLTQNPEDYEGIYNWIMSDYKVHIKEYKRQRKEFLASSLQ